MALAAPDQRPRPRRPEEDEPTAEDIDNFVIENRQWLSEEAEDVLRKMNAKDQLAVIEEGSMSNCRDPVAIVKSRAWQGHLRRNREWVQERKQMPVKQLIEDFLEANASVMNEEAEEVLRAMNPADQRRVIEVGSLSGCRDPVAIIKTRAKQGHLSAKGKAAKAKKGKGGGKESSHWDSWDSWDSSDGWSSSGWRGGWDSDQWDTGKANEDCFKEEKLQRREDINMENLAAVNEGRSLYVVGLPPMWTPKQLEDFFSHQGKVHRAHMMAVKPGTGTRAAFVNFANADDATSAAEVCDQLEIEDRGDKYTLTCSIKQRTGEKTYGKKHSPFSAGYVDHNRARTEMRVAFVSKLPLDVQELQIRSLSQPYGTVEEIHMLPSNGINQACFITMASAGEAGILIQSLNGASFYGNVLTACYPREREDKKRKRPPAEEQADEFVVEIRNFPHWTETEDLKAVLETARHEVQRLKILNHDPKGQASLARAHFDSLEAMHTVVKMLNGFEFTPGYPLQLAAVPPASQRHAADLGAGAPQAWAAAMQAGVGMWPGGALQVPGQWNSGHSYLTA